MAKNQGPYYENQKSAPCGHYYPNVMRVKDIIREGSAVRILDCEICHKQYEMEISPESFNEESIHEVDLPTLRESALVRIYVRDRINE